MLLSPQCLSTCLTFAIGSDATIQRGDRRSSWKLLQTTTKFEFGCRLCSPAVPLNCPVPFLLLLHTNSSCCGSGLLLLRCRRRDAVAATVFYGTASQPLFYYYLLLLFFFQMKYYDYYNYYFLNFTCMCVRDVGLPQVAVPEAREEAAGAAQEPPTPSAKPNTGDPARDKLAVSLGDALAKVLEESEVCRRVWVYAVRCARRSRSNLPIPCSVLVVEPVVCPRLSLVAQW